MIIGIDASRANEEQKTGVGWYAWHVIQEMKRITPDDEIEFVLYTREPLRGALGDLPENWTQKVLRWPPKRLWTQVRLSWEMLWHPPDVLFVPAHVFPTIHPKKTVMTVHDVAAKQFPGAYSRFERWYSLWSAKKAARRLWKIITPSAFTKKEIQTIAPGADNIEVIPHGYDEAFRKKYSKEQVARVLKKYSINTPFLFSIGRLEHKKNTKHIVKALSLLAKDEATKDMQLVLAGKPGFGFADIKPLLEAQNEHVRVLGWVAQEDIPVLMQAAEMFVFPSLYEGFGIPILEAFAAGTPVITARGSATEEVAGSAAAFVPNNATAKDIADAILRMWKHAHQSQALVESGKARVAGFSWVQTAKDTHTVLTS